MISVRDWLHDRNTLWGWFDWLFVAVLVGYSIVVWWPTRVLPHWWDAFYVVENTQILLENGFWPIVGHVSAFARPPLMLVITGIAWLVGGQTLLTSHLVMLPALPMLVVGTYLLGKRLTTPLVGIVSALAVGATPVVLAEYGVLYVDIYVGALTVVASVLLLYKRWFWFSIIMSLAVLMKESALMLLPTLAFFMWWLEKQVNLRQLVWLFIPGLVFALWLVYHKLMMGWWLVNPERATRFGVRMSDVMSVFERFLTQQGMMGGTLLLVTVGVLLFIQRKHLSISQVLPPLIGLSAPVIALFSYAILGEFGLRYAILVLPFYFVGVFGLFEQVISQFDMPLNRKSMTIFLAGGIVLIFLVFAQDPTEPLTQRVTLAPPHDLRYLDMIAIFEKAAGFIEEEHPDAKVFGAFPENLQLTNTGMGYVQAPVDFSLCADFTYNENVTQLLYIHLYSPVQQECHRIAQQYSFERLYRSQTGGRWLDIVRVGSESGELSHTVN